MGHARFSTELAQVTWLYGENDDGKSARYQAMRIALCGGIPGKEPGKLMPTNQLLHDFAWRGNSMSCQVNFDTISARTMVWHNGKLTADAYSGPASDRLERFPASMFAASELLTLSGPERLRTLFAVLPPAAGFADLATVKDKVIVQIKNVKLEPHTTAAEDEIKEIISELTNAKGQTVQDFLAWLVESTKEGTKKANGYFQSMKKTAAGATYLRSNDGPTLAEATKARDVAAEALRVAEAERTTLAAQWKQAKAELDKAKATASSYQPPEPGAREKLEARITELRALVAKPLPELAPEADQKAVDDASTAHGDATLEVSRIIDSEEHAAKNVDRLESDIAGITALKCCPTCKATGAKWCDKAVSEFTAQLGDAKRELSRCQLTYKTLSERQRQTSNALTNARAEFLKIKQARNASETARIAADKEQRRNYADLETHTRAIANLDATAARQAPALAAAALIPELEQRLAGLVLAGEQTVEPMTKLKSAVAFANQTLATAQTEAGKAAAAALASEQADAAEQAAGVRKAVSAAVAEMQSECVKCAIEPFLARANSLCGGFLKSPLVYRDGDIGRVMDGKFIELQAASYGGTARTLAHAAICVALSAGQPCRIAVIDEVGNLSKRNRQRLVDTLCGLVAAKEIDSALLLGPDKPDVTRPIVDSLFSAVHIQPGK